MNRLMISIYRLMVARMYSSGDSFCISIWTQQNSVISAEYAVSTTYNNFTHNYIFLWYNLEEQLSAFFHG
jgi:hypothetical protein